MSVKIPAFSPPKTGEREEKKNKPDLGPLVAPVGKSSKGYDDRVKQAGKRGGVAAGKRGRRGRARRQEDTEQFIRNQLVEIRVRSARGQIVHAVFDIDDVVCDTRPRTLAIARAYDLQHGTGYFDRLTLDDVGGSPLETCELLDVPRRVRKPFEEFWLADIQNPGHFDLDTPIVRLISHVRQAEAAGADVVFLTSRSEAVKAQTFAQLKRLGVPVREQFLISRPVNQPSVTQFMRDVFARWFKLGEHVAWFLTANRPLVASLQRHLHELTCVLVETPWRQDGEEHIRDDTLVYFLED